MLLISLLIRAKHFYVVISQTNVLQPGIGLIGSRSTPILMLLMGIYFSATYSLNYKKTYHPPGAAHKSTKTLEFCKKLNFLLS